MSLIRVEDFFIADVGYSFAKTAPAPLNGKAQADLTAVGGAGPASRFLVLKWVPAYLRWYWYAFATTFLRLPANSVKQRSAWKTAK
jgi:hypothetical protein